MRHLVELIVLFGGLVATVAVAAMCAVCLVVWVLGCLPGVKTDPWRPADES